MVCVTLKKHQLSGCESDYSAEPWGLLLIIGSFIYNVSGRFFSFDALSSRSDR
jgi:hypothetical protein